MKRNSKLLLIFLLIIFGVNFLSAYENGIEIKSDFAGVKVWIDGSYKGETEAKFGMNVLRVENLTPGKHFIKCSFEGFEDYRTNIQVPRDEVKVHNVRFVRSKVKVESIDNTSGQQKSETGTIKVKSKPTGATVKLNGKAKGNADLIFRDVPVGDKTIKVYFSNSPSDYLEISFQLNKHDEITVTADFYNMTIYHNAKYTVTFDSKPSGTLYINGKRIGKCPITKKLPYGKHNIKIKKDGYETYSEKINVKSNSFINPKLSGLGKLNFKINKKDASIYIDGKYAGIGDITVDKRDGYHNIEITKSGYLTEKFSVPVEVKTTTIVEANIINISQINKQIQSHQRNIKTWENYYDSSLKKNKYEIIKGDYHCDYQARQLGLQIFLDAIMGAGFCYDFLFSSIEYKFKVPSEPDGFLMDKFTYIETIAEYKEKKYPCIHLVYLDPDAFTETKQVISEKNVKYNENLKSIAKEEAKKDNYNKEIQNVINDLERTKQDIIKNRYIKFRIGPGNFKDITPTIDSDKY